MQNDFKGIPSDADPLIIVSDNGNLNSSVPTSLVRASNGSASSVDLCLIPKGVGAFQLGASDGSLTGGDKRGNKAIDLQLLRTSKVQVASGAGAVALGVGNTASGINSFAHGKSSSTFGLTGKKVYSSERISVDGDNQKGEQSLFATTTGATSPVLTVDGGIGTALNVPVLQNNSAYHFRGIIIQKESASTNCSSWLVDGLIVRGANAASTVLVASTVTAYSNVPVYTTPSLAANTTLGSLAITVTGVAATTMSWACHLETFELIKV
jgi:hypothetical protein